MALPLDLKSQFQGTVILPGDADFDEARKVFYGGIDKKPGAVIRVANAEDIQKAIALAKERKLEIAIRSGGHSVSGFSTTEGGIVIDLRAMKKIEIDESKKTVWAETGLTAGEVTNALDAHNLMVGFGDTASVGIGGITLGGGVGFLVRKFGLTIDNLLAAEMVTADGQILQVDAEHHPELFWAIRGGGGNFGVVTRFQYALHELREVYGGMLILPATPVVIAQCIAIASSAPAELSGIFNVMPTFPMPFVPSEYHGKLSVMAMLMYAGGAAEGEKVIAPFRALAKPYADTVKAMRYKDMFPPEQGEFHPTAVSRNMHLNRVDEALATTVLEWIEKLDAPMKALQLRVLGGAMADVSEDATAYAHRKQPIMANIAAFYETEDQKQKHQEWVDGFANAISQGEKAAYVGFLSPVENDRIADAYPSKTLERLREVKHQYDPENLFHLNSNVF